MHAHRFVRLLPVFLVALALGLALPGGTLAAKPPPAVVDGVAFSLPTAETGCGFQVDLVVTGKAAQIDLPDGRTLFTSPGLDVVVTNHDTGAAVTLNITGAAHVTANADGSVTWVATGRNLLWGGVEDELVLTRGRFTWTFFPDGSVSPQAGTGHKTNVCALIA
jgi:hypothetical protein